MVIDLLSPFWGSLVAGLLISFVSLGVTGVIKFSSMAHDKKVIEDSFFRLRAEFESLQKKNQEKITDIDKSRTEEIKKAIQATSDFYTQKIEEILKQNQPPENMTKRMTLREALSGYKPKPR